MRSLLLKFAATERIAAAAGVCQKTESRKHCENSGFFKNYPHLCSQMACEIPMMMQGSNLKDVELSLLHASFELCAGGGESALTERRHESLGSLKH
jgi:hypothetical protein